MTVLHAENNELSPQDPCAAASAFLGLYTFSKMVLNLERDAPNNDQFELMEGGASQTKWVGIFWHEYAHYIQNVTTSFGANVFLNYIALMISFAKNCISTQPIRAPIYCIPGNKFAEEYKNVNAEIIKFMNIDGEADTNPPSEAVDFSIYIRDNTPTTAYMLVNHAGKKIGVPLTGAAMIEGMAYAIQLLVESDGVWNDNVLDTLYKNECNFHYIAVIRYFRHHYPNTNPCWPAVLISHFCLMTDQPAYYFYIIDKHLPRNIATKEEWIKVRTHLLQHPKVANNILKVQRALEELKSEFNTKPKTSFTNLCDDLINALGANLTAQNSREFCTALLNPSYESLKYFADNYGSPLIRFKNNVQYRVPGKGSIPDLASILFSAVELMDGLYRDGLKGECPYLRTFKCNGKKGKYCRVDRLKIPEYNGEICIMGYAARLLGVLGCDVVTSS